MVLYIQTAAKNAFGGAERTRRLVDTKRRRQNEPTLQKTLTKLDEMATHNDTHEIQTPRTMVKKANHRHWVVNR